jgi:hypothetical protein
MLSSRIRTFIVVAITTVWVLNFGASVALPDYKAPPEINSIFMAMVGTVLVTAPMVGGRNRREEEQNPGEDEQRPPTTVRGNDEPT